MTDEIKKFNRGDVAEGILGAALTAKFVNRPKSLKEKNKSITKKMIDDVLDKFFKKNQMIAFKAKDIAATKVSGIIDIVNFSISLPEAAANFLSKKNNRDVVIDLYNSAIKYVEETWTDDVMKFALNGQMDQITILSDGVGDQKGTKADIKITINGIPYEKQISLKVSGGEQFAQVSGDEFEKQQKIWEDILMLDISNLKQKYLKEIKNYDKKEVFSSRDNEKLNSFKDMIKAAASVVYKDAAKQIQQKINSKDNKFFNNLAKLVFEGATRGDTSIELVKLEGGKFKRLQFNEDFVKIYSDQLKKSKLIAKFRESGDPLVQLYAGTENKQNLILQIRVKVEAASTYSQNIGKVYRPYMRNYVEAGPLMFGLLNK